MASQMADRILQVQREGVLNPLPQTFYYAAHKQVLAFILARLLPFSHTSIHPQPLKVFLAVPTVDGL